MNRMLERAAAAAILAAVVAGPALAQRGGDVVGKWKAEAVGNNGQVQTCDVELKAAESFGAFQASSFGCFGDLFSTHKWQVRGGEVVILNMAGQELAVLYRRGDQLIGQDKSGRRVVFTRPGQPPRVGGSSGGQWGSNGGGQWGSNGGGQWGSNGGGQWNGGAAQACTVLGDTGRCAQPSAMRAPAPGDSIQTLLPLNLRERPAAGRTLTTVPKGACVVVDDCVRAEGSLWCRVDHDGQVGYVRQTADRNGQRTLAFQYACG